MQQTCVRPDGARQVVRRAPPPAMTYYDHKRDCVGVQLRDPEKLPSAYLTPPAVECAMTGG